MCWPRGSGLIVQVTESDQLSYRKNLFYDLVRTAELRLVFALTEELAAHGITVVAVSPGYLRSESTLDGFGVTEATWREAIEKDPHFAASETPAFVGRAVVALAGDPPVARRTGGVYGSWTLARKYGFTDLDGSRPDLGRQPGEFPFGPPRTRVRWRIEPEARLSGDPDPRQVCPGPGGVSTPYHRRRRPGSRPAAG
jgi:hypothetical protein